jgi:ribulose 1,5-bisphosphate carboxylase large subunit-like protein
MSDHRFDGPSDEHFRVVYRIRGDEGEARTIAGDICIEQTVEFPSELISDALRERVVGRIERFERVAHAAWEATIAYPVETAGGELTQLLNVVFGNYSMKRGVRVERLELSDEGANLTPRPSPGAPGGRTSPPAPSPGAPGEGGRTDPTPAPRPPRGEGDKSGANPASARAFVTPSSERGASFASPSGRGCPRAGEGGPRFGRAGLRERLGVPRGPLLSTAIKPMGLPATELADLTYRLALGGIDLIKDDHGLANQAFATFSERLERCVEAVERANRETGRRSVYVPNVSADGEETQRRARQARSSGAGSILVSPGLVGFGTMARLAADPAVDLPILSHPTFLGSFVASPDSGISHFALFGQITRLAGADGSIFPSYGGRFAWTQDECRAIAEGTAIPMGPFQPCFPVPGGGMRVERISELVRFYGPDVIFLIGGGLHQAGPDLVATGRALRAAVERAT